jgi:hypothetical protein
MIKFMHEGRTYALLVLLAAVAIWCYWRILKEHRGWLTMGGLLLAAAGLLYSHYFASLMVFSICLYHLVFVRKDRKWWRVVVIMGLAGALFLPWVLPNFDAVQGANNQGWRQEMAMSAPELVDEVLVFFGNGSLAMLLLLGVFAVDLRQRDNRLLWFLLLCPVVLGLVVNIWLGMLVSSKFYLYLWIPLSLLFGVGLTGLARRGLHPAYILLPWLIAGTWVVVNAEEDPVKYIAWDVLHDQLAGQTAEDDAVIFHLQATDWDGAHNRGVEYYFHDFSHTPDMVWSWPHAADDVYVNGIQSAIEGKVRVWSAYDPTQRPARVGTVFEPLMQSAGFADCGQVIDEPLMRVYLYSRPPQGDFDYDFGTDAYPAGIAMSTLGAITRLQDGRVLVPLGWQLGRDVPLNTYSYGLHVFDASGALVTQADQGLPPNHEFGCQAAQISTDNLPAGDYDLHLVVYAWETGDRLTINGSDTIDLGSFHVD